MNVPENEVAFKQLGPTIPRKTASVQQVQIDGKIVSANWVYYDTVTCDSTADSFPTLVCIPDIANTALSFFRQLTALTAHGIRVVAVTPAGYADVECFSQALDVFVTSVLKKTKVHFFGVGLGAYLIQCYAKTFRARIKSAILCNGFYSTAAMQPTLFQRTAVVMPEFMLKRHFLAKLNAEADTPLLVDLVNLSTTMIESMNGSQLAGQLSMMLPESGLSVAIDNKIVTILRSSNVKLYNQATESDYEKVYSDAKVAELRDGGNMPQIAAAEEVNLHIRVHIRNMEEDSKPKTSAEDSTTTTTTSSSS